MMKRILDIVVSSIILLAASPILIVVGLLVLYKIGRPIFFIQQRPGFNEKPFKMIKFRTMKNIVGPDGQLLPDAERLTHFGKFLRASSIDELPELWNVVNGDMSLVGPRPLLMEYLELYSPEQARRHEIKPGVTGWAQVNGRNALDWDEKFSLDVWYVDNQSLQLDLRILWMTLKKVALRDNISADGEATMSKFTGQNSSRLK